MRKMRNHGRKKRMGRIFVWGMGAILLTALLVMALWNALIPSLFGGPFITYLQALGLLVLAKILFTGWVPGRRPMGMRGCGKRGYWRRRMKEKMKSMMPEERASFKKGFEEAFQGKWDINVFEVEDEGNEEENTSIQGSFSEKSEEKKAEDGNEGNNSDEDRKEP